MYPKNPPKLLTRLPTYQNIIPWHIWNLGRPWRLVVVRIQFGVVFDCCLHAKYFVLLNRKNSYIKRKETRPVNRIPFLKSFNKPSCRQYVHHIRAMGINLSKFVWATDEQNNKKTKKKQKKNGEKTKVIPRNIGWSAYTMTVFRGIGGEAGTPSGMPPAQKKWGGGGRETDFSIPTCVYIYTYIIYVYKIVQYFVIVEVGQGLCVFMAWFIVVRWLETSIRFCLNCCFFPYCQLEVFD